jgi:long-chain acyl-CoA synthetase
MSPAAQNLAELTELAYERRGDYPSLWFEERWQSSGEIFERGRRMAGGLIAAGIEPGDRVVVTMANCPEVGIAYHAVWRAGAVVTPAMFLLPAPDLRHIIEDSGARAVITTPEVHEKVLEATEGLSELRLIACSGEAADDPRLTALSALEAHDPAAIAPRAGEDLAALLYTGGTTGRSKGVMLTHSSLAYTGAAAHEASYEPGISRGLVTLPLSHAYGLLVTMAGLHHPEQISTILMRWFEPERYLQLIGRHRVQQTAAVPSMLQVLLGQPLQEHDLRSLRWISSGGAPLAPETEAELRRRLPWVSVRQGYGLTETAALVSTNPVGQERSGSVGRAIPGCRVVILDDHDAPVASGQPGEVCCASPGVMHGYWNAPESTAEALRGGLLHTGDIGYLDEDGYLYIVDRKKDLIIRGGFNVYPRDVEDALLEHPEIAAAGVVGRPDPRLGEEVVAFVTLRPGAACEPGELLEWGRERLGGYRYPREIHMIDAVPLTPVGKIDRKALRARLA